VFVSGDVTINDSLFTGNTSSVGGGIRASGSVAIRHSDISDNVAHGFGGGIWASDNVTIDKSEIIRNHADELGGGIINVNGLVNGQKPIVSENTAGVDGGGIFTAAGATTTLHKTIVSGNTPNDVVP